MKYNYNQLTAIDVPEETWGKILSMLPVMKYQIPNTGRTQQFIHPSLKLYQDKNDAKNVLLLVQMDIKSHNKRIIFQTGNLIAEKNLSDYVSVSGAFRNQTEFVDFVINTLASDVQNAFEELCTRVPWSLINKLRNVLCKLYEDASVFRRGQDNDYWVSATSTYYEEDIFCFKKPHFSSLIIQKEGYNYESTITYLVTGILNGVTKGLNPINNYTTTVLIHQEKEFVKNFRTYIREVALLSYYYLRMQSEEEFLITKPNGGKYMNKKDWAYMEKHFNHRWKNSYDQKLATVVKIFNDMVAIMQLH